MSTSGDSHGRKILILDEKPIESGIVVRLSGSASMQDTTPLRSRLRELAESHPSLIVLDLSQVDFIYSEGLEAILHCHLTLTRSCGGHVCLVNPQPYVREVFDISRLTILFPVFPSVEAAVAAFK